MIEDLTTDEALGILDDLDSEAELTEWEINVVDDLMKRLESGMPLTPPQKMTLLELKAKHL